MTDKLWNICGKSTNMDNCGNRNTLQLEKHIVIFGMINNETCRFVNWLIINIKHYIYRIKVQKQKLNIKAIKNILQKLFQIEKYILFKNCVYNLFIEYWSLLGQNAIFTDVCVIRKKGEKHFL